MENNFEPEISAVTCPQCGAVSNFVGWPVIPNVFLPDAANALLEGSLFEYTCEKCGYFDLAPYECLYHDVPHAKVVLLEPEPEKRAEAQALLAHMVHDDGSVGAHDALKHEARLVSHPDYLTEKARIFDAGLDDCAIELMKLKIKEDLIGEDVLFEVMELFFESADDEHIEFSAFGYEDGMVDAMRTLYDEEVINLMMNPPKIEDFVVDERWARSHLIDLVHEEAGAQ